ncbi:MAG: hypothetical protein PHF31_17255 [Methylobacter sp.]|nr:hypothetical protein [Methylobacter sp.]
MKRHGCLNNWVGDGNGYVGDINLIGGTYIGEISTPGIEVPGMGRSFNVGMTVNH